MGLGLLFCLTLHYACGKLDVVGLRCRAEEPRVFKRPDPLQRAVKGTRRMVILLPRVACVRAPADV